MHEHAQTDKCIKHAKYVRAHQRTKTPTFEVNPSALDVDPDIEEGVDAVQLLFPRKSIFLELLEVGRELHRRDLVHVLLDLVEQIVPSADQAAFVLETKVRHVSVFIRGCSIIRTDR